MINEIEYNLEYFIDKFKKIRDSEIGTGSVANHDILYHCGHSFLMPDDTTKESRALLHILGADKTYLVQYATDLNDNYKGLYPGDTAKSRIMNRLRKIRTETTFKHFKIIQTELQYA